MKKNPEKYFIDQRCWGTEKAILDISAWFEILERFTLQYFQYSQTAKIVN